MRAGVWTGTRRSRLRRVPLDARRYRSDSSGPTRRTARPSESSVSGAGVHGSPGRRVQSVARVAAGTSTVTVTLSPRRTVVRSTLSRTGERASASVRNRSEERRVGKESNSGEAGNGEEQKREDEAYPARNDRLT